ncbi:unnamed protein product, partial [Mesorhabditis belari]|uniref:Uncharacterized protein n=1 Tax=Mesorhabditis belari TaxID=2138241 RepID=A0AAF3FMW0_9BILA
MVMIRPFDKKKVKIEIDPRIKIKTVDAMVAGVNIDEWEKEQSEMIFEYDYCPIGLNHIAGVKGWFWLNSGLMMDWVARCDRCSTHSPAIRRLLVRNMGGWCVGAMMMEARLKDELLRAIEEFLLARTLAFQGHLSQHDP